MPGLYKDEGVILKTIKLGEADRIVTIFTRSNGKVRAVAKGVRKTKSRFGARLEPFTQAELMIYKGRNLDTITSVDIVRSFDEVRTDYRCLTSAAALAEVVEKMTEERERSQPTYSLLVAGLQALGAGPCDSIVPAFLIKLLSISGYHPQLSVCAGCGATSGLGGFSAGLGGAVCETCWRQDRDAERLGVERIAALNRLLAEDLGYEADEFAGELTQLLRRYTEYHLERPLKSLHLLATA
jgi:DNA repair protein RecO (recombination protein O)